MLLTGDTIIETYIRLFVTLIIFDDIYRVHFKANTRKISVMTYVYGTFIMLIIDLIFCVVVVI